jgi:hypothetical protein
VLGEPVEESDQLVPAVRRPGRVVRVADVDELRPRADRGEQALEVVRVVTKRDSAGRGAELRGREDVAREGRPAAHHLVARVERRLRQQIDDPVGARSDDQLLEGDAVPLRKLRPQ